jgi:LDH2 family malate/lactate/ureidoglycolate dehydrogenase
MTAPAAGPSDATDRVSVDRLRRQLEAALQAEGVPAADAALVVDTVLEAELDGSTGHGLVRFPLLVRRLRAGRYEPTTELTTVAETDGTAVVDGNNGIGQVVLHRAMLLAVDKARNTGVGFVAVRDSNHAGRIGDAALVGAAQGCVALVGSNASPRLVPAPGARRLLGNNPLAFAAPGTDHPLLIDLAPGVATVGSIRLAKLEGRPLPEGVALDPSGEPTTDATAGLAGGMLGVGGHKGWVLALLVDVLAGVLSGGAIADEVGPTQDLDRQQHVSHFLLAVDVGSLLPPDAFAARLDDLRDKVVAAGDGRGRLPGDRRAQRQPMATLALSPALRRELVDVLGHPLDVEPADHPSSAQTTTDGTDPR